MRGFLFCCFIWFLYAGNAYADSSLWKFKRISDGLFVVQTAILITENCPRLKQRKVRGLFFLLGLRSYALDQGYTLEQVNDFVGDPKEKAKLNARIDKYLRSIGRDRSKKNDLCSFGERQIETGSQVGHFLRK